MSKHRIKFYGRLKQTLVCICLALFLVSVGIPADISQAQRRFKPEVVLPHDYPDGFDGFGQISAWDDNKIWIGDMVIKLAPSVTFHTPTKMDGYITDFNTDDMVGWLKNPEGEITSLWLIP